MIWFKQTDQINWNGFKNTLKKGAPKNHNLKIVFKGNVNLLYSKVNTIN